MDKERIILSIVIISYNTKQLTCECISSVVKNTEFNNYEIIVLDNNSSDGSAQAIQEQFPECKLIASNINLGFAQGNNEAIKNATGEYILLLNPDTLVNSNSIGILLKFAIKSKKYKIYGGRTLFSDGTLNPSSCWKKQTPWSVFCYAIGLTALFAKSSFFNPEGYGGWLRDTIREVDIVSGCFFLLTKRFWDELNGFDKVFFMYGEEADLCLRAKKLGASPIVISDSEIIHYGGASENVREDKIVRLYKARIKLIERHWNKNWINAGKLLYKVAALIRMSGFYIFSHLKNSPYYFKKYEQWRNILQRRSEWG